MPNVASRVNVPNGHSNRKCRLFRQHRRVGPGNFTLSLSQISDLILSHHPAMLGLCFSHGDPRLKPLLQCSSLAEYLSHLGCRHQVGVYFVLERRCRRPQRHWSRLRSLSQWAMTARQSAASQNSRRGYCSLNKQRTPADHGQFPFRCAA